MGTRLKGAAFPLERDAVLQLRIDVQRLLSDQTAGQMPWLPRVLPAGGEIASRPAARTIFTGFAPPASSKPPRDLAVPLRTLAADDVRRAGCGLLDIVEPLARLVPPAREIEKPATLP